MYGKIALVLAFAICMTAFYAEADPGYSGYYQYYGKSYSKSSGRGYNSGYSKSKNKGYSNGYYNSYGNDYGNGYYGGNNNNKGYY